jgi:hypothetical protein
MMLYSPVIITQAREQYSEVGKMAGLGCSFLQLAGSRKRSLGPAEVFARMLPKA